MAFRHHARRCLFASASLFLIVLHSTALAASADAGSSPATAEAAPQASLDKPPTELYGLTNEDLLAQAQDTLTGATDRLRGQMRALAIADHQYQQARQARLALQPPATQNNAQTTQPLEQARAVAGIAQAKQVFAQHQLQRIEQEQADLEVWLQHNKLAAQAAEALLGVIDRLRDGAVLEIGLRMQDGTLSAVPDALSDKSLDHAADTARLQQAELRKTLQQRQQDLHALGALRPEAAQAAKQAEHQVDITRQDYQHALKRRELEKLYADQSAEQRASAFATLQEERIWLQGSVKLSQARFASLNAQAAPVAQPEQASLQSIAAYDDHISQLQRQQAALKELDQFAPVILADIDLMRAHLFKMLVLAQQDDAQAAQVDELIRALQKIQDDGQRIDRVLTDAPQRISQLDGLLERERKQRDQMQAELAEAARKQSAAQQNKAREAHLKTLDDQQLVQYFTNTRQTVQEQQQGNQAQMAAVEQAERQVDTGKTQMQAVKDPLIRAAAQQASAEKAGILQELYELAGLQAPSAEPAGQNANASRAPKNQIVAEADDSKKTVAELQHYERLLSAGLRSMEEHKQKRTQLLVALNELQQALQSQSSHLDNIRQKRLDLYAAAVELRKRLGQGSLAQNDIPDGITDALQREPLTRLDDEIAGLVNHQARLTETIEHWSLPADTDSALEKKLQAIRVLVGKRIDIFDDLHRLQDSMALGTDDLPESAQKTLQQAAIRRMESEHGLRDLLLGFVPSTRAQTILDLMQSYYAELIHLEDQQDSLVTQKTQTENLIEYARAEQQALHELIPLVQARLDRQKQQRAGYAVSAHAQLAPDRADEIRQAYQSQTGQIPGMPTPLPETLRQQAITDFANTLFDYQIRIMASRQWIDQLEARLTAVGINREIEHYRDTLNAVDDQSARIDRRIHHLVGYAKEQSNGASEPVQEGESQPQSAAGPAANALMAASVSNGQINESRDALYRIRLQGALSVVYRIVAILVVAALLIWLINHFMSRIIHRCSTPKAGQAADQHAILAWTAIRSVSKIVVQIVALIMILSNLGFQVGAILAGLGIGGLAVAMAAKESLSNILAGIMIFLDKPFTVGDVIKVGSHGTAKVESIGWRTTAVATPFGYYTHIPNSEVAENPVTNYTKLFPAGDYISVFVSYEYDPERICALLDQALAQCTAIEQDQDKGTIMAGVKVIHQDAWVEYWPWWYTKNYHGRGGQRAQVWQQIWRVLTEEGITFKRPDTAPDPSRLLLTDHAKDARPAGRVAQDDMG